MTATLRLAGGQVYTLTVYPTQELYDTFNSNTPRNTAVGVAVLIAGTILLVLLLQAIEAHRFKRVNHLSSVASRLLDDVRRPPPCRRAPTTADHACPLSQIQVLCPSADFPDQSEGAHDGCCG